MLVLTALAVGLVAALGARAATPGVSILTSPPSVVSAKVAAFTFVVNQPRRVIDRARCAVDMRSVVCPLIRSLTGSRTLGGAVVGGLADGEHTFSVQVYLKGLTTPESASRQWRIDTEPPTFRAVPDELVVAADRPGGAVVTYALPVATDSADPAPRVTCSPASGSLFALGSSTVRCEAKDSAGNRSRTTFSIGVVRAQLVSPAGGTVVSAAVPGASVIVPAAAFAQATNVGLAPAANPNTAAPAGLVGQTFSIASGAEPSVPVEIRVPYDPVVSGPASDVTLAWWSADTGSWWPVPTKFENGFLSGQTGHFSLWGWVAKKIIEPFWGPIGPDVPSCVTPPPSWATVNEVAAGAFSVAMSCGGRSSGGDFEVRVRSAGNHAIEVRFLREPSAMRIDGAYAQNGVRSAQVGSESRIVVLPGSTLVAQFARPLATPSATRFPVFGYALRDANTYLLDASMVVIDAVADLLPAEKSLVKKAIQKAMIHCIGAITSDELSLVADCLLSETVGDAELSPLGSAKISALLNPWKSKFGKPSFYLDVFKASRDATLALLNSNAKPTVIDAVLSGETTSGGGGATVPLTLGLLSSSSAAAPGNNHTFPFASWASDGRRVVFVSRATNLDAVPLGFYIGLFEKNLTTGSTRLVYADLHQNGDGWSQPSQTSDSRLIAIRIGSAIHVIDVSTGSDRVVRRFTSNPQSGSATSYSATAISPDGSELAYVREDYDGLSASASHGVFVENLSTGAVRSVMPLLPHTAEYALHSWSPDGARLLVDLGGSLYAVDAATGSTKLVAADVRDGSWSPDSETVALAYCGQSGRTGVYTVDVATLATRQLNNVCSDSAVWSPGGGAVAVRGRDSISSAQHIYVTDTVTGSTRSLTATITTTGLGSIPAGWAPDSAHVAFVSDGTNLPGGNPSQVEQLYVVETESGTATP